MKTFVNYAAQGDLYLRRVHAIPVTAVAVKSSNGQYICAHSESGHSHIVVDRPNVKLYDTDNPLVSYLEVIEATDATETLLEHLRGYDTHETVSIPPGIYEIRRQREFVPEGFRRVQD